MAEQDEISRSAAAVAASRFGMVPVEITVNVGTARPLIRDLLTLETDAVIPLDRTLNDPVELYVGDKLIARGDLEEVGGEGSGQLGVRLTEIIDLPNGPGK